MLVEDYIGASLEEHGVGLDAWAQRALRTANSLVIEGVLQQSRSHVAQHYSRDPNAALMALVRNLDRTRTSDETIRTPFALVPCVMYSIHESCCWQLRRSREWQRLGPEFFDCHAVTARTVLERELVALRELHDATSREISQLRLRLVEDADEIARLGALASERESAREEVARLRWRVVELQEQLLHASVEEEAREFRELLDARDAELARLRAERVEVVASPRACADFALGAEDVVAPSSCAAPGAEQGELLRFSTTDETSLLMEGCRRVRCREEFLRLSTAV